MTEEIEAEANDWIRSQGWSEETLPSDEYNQMMSAYVAGYEAGKPKWHKVADGDLPQEPENLKNLPDNHRCEWFIVATAGRPSRALYSFAKKRWFLDYEDMQFGSSFVPKAWCEFPEYE